MGQIAQTVQNVYLSWSFGGRQRQPRSAGSSTNLALIPGTQPVPQQPLASNSTAYVYQLPPTVPPNTPSVNYVFAFTSVSDGATVGFVLPAPPANSNPPAYQYQTGTNPITISYVFIAVGIGGHPGPPESGADIDAFDSTTAILVDNSFVLAVQTGNANAAQEDTVADANQQGFLETTDTFVKITADSPAIGAPFEPTIPASVNAPANAVFVNWLTIWSSNGQNLGTIAGSILTVPEGVSVYSLAIYTNPPTPSKTTTLAVEKLQHPDKANHLIDKVPSPDKNDSFDKQAQDIYKGQHLTEKQTDKPFIGESKQLGDNPGAPGILRAFALNYQDLSQKIADREATLAPGPRGQAFIKEADRPAVGRTVARNPARAS